jgi:putative oxidoreductase
MTKNGVPMAEPLLVLTLVLEIVGGLVLILGWNTRWVATALAIFVAIITPIFHGFWNFPPEQYVNQLNHFLKNGAVLGGLLYIAAFGAGAMSVDGRGRRR